MTPEELKARTKAFALRVVRLVDSLPVQRSAEIIGRQLLRSGCSVGANYRAACRARSHAEFISKMGIVLEEADETVYWMELLAGSGCTKAARLADLLREANELVAISVASINTAKKRR